MKMVGNSERKISAIRSYVEKRGSTVIVDLPGAASPSLRGYGDIQVLYGEVLCVGAKLTAETAKWTPICSAPVLGPPGSIRNITDESSIDKKQLRERLKQLCSDDLVREIFADFHPAHAYIAIRPASDKSISLAMLEKTFKTVFAAAQNQSESLKILPTLDLYYSDGTARKEVTDEKIVETSEQEGFKRVIMAIGPTGIGKSTFLRCLYNGYLSEENLGSFVYYLDLDLGQPEFTPPGCVSLHRISEPQLSPPFFHLSKPLKCYFVGSSHFADNHRVYLARANSLIEHFNAIAEPTAMLFVNTAGWINGMGCDILSCLIHLLKPDEIVELKFESNEEETYFSTSKVGNAVAYATQLGLLPTCLTPRVTSPLHYQLSVLNIHTEHEGNGHSDMISRDVRDLMLMAYFCQGLSQEFPTVLGQKPYMVPWCSVGIIISADQSSCLPVPDEQIMAVLNASLVALCSCDSAEILDTHFNGNTTHPRKVSAAAMPECIGFGLVRGIDMQRKLFLLITPLEADQLSSVNCLWRGAIESPPQILLNQQKSHDLRDCPYLMRIKKKADGTAQPAVSKAARFKTRRMKRSYLQTC